MSVGRVEAAHVMSDTAGLSKRGVVRLDTFCGLEGAVVEVYRQTTPATAMTAPRKVFDQVGPSLRFVAVVMLCLNVLMVWCCW